MHDRPHAEKCNSYKITPVINSFFTNRQRCVDSWLKETQPTLSPRRWVWMSNCRSAKFSVAKFVRGPIHFFPSMRRDILFWRAKGPDGQLVGQEAINGLGAAPWAARLGISFVVGAAVMSRRPRDFMFGWLKTVDRREVRYPPGPEGMRLYAIGDIHGRSDCLRRAHDLIDRDIAERDAGDRTLEIYIGDYVDRGPDSKGVIDLLVARSIATSTVFLRGNHEIVMESFLRGQIPFEDWRRLGGLETVLSYGVDARGLLEKGGIRPRDLAEKVPVSHLRFISSLKSVYTAGGYCFVHAGIRPGVAIERQSIGDLAWIRGDFLNFTGSFGFIVIHGHTPVKSIDFLSNRINLDTGAYMTNRLSVLRIDAEGVSALEPAAK